jgi:hypothetical protein
MGYLGVFVVNSVISAPMPNTALVRDRVAKHQSDAERKSGFVRSM